MSVPLINCDSFADDLPPEPVEINQHTTEPPTMLNDDTDKVGNGNLPATDDKNTAEKAAEQPTPKKRGRPKKVKDGLDSSHVEIPETNTAIIESGAAVNPDVDVDTNNEPEKPKPIIDLSTAITPRLEINTFPTEDKLPCYRVYEKKVIAGDTTLKAGTYYHHVKVIKEETVIIHKWICAPLYIESVTLDQQGNNFGRFLRFKPTRGSWRRWCMAMAMLKGSCDELRGELLSQGLSMDTDNKALLPRYLNNYHPKDTLEIATQTGWHKGAYILPNRCIGSDDYFYQSENFHTDIPYRQSGTLAEWQQHIARYCVDNPLLILSVCCAFAGALLKPAHQQGGGFHLVGGSSKGKTTGLEVGCSVHGDSSYKRTWKATGNGMEATAAMHNDGFLALDEMGECEPREVGNIVYQVANGVGKARANRSGGARASYQWLVMVLSNGEISIEAAMQEAGKRVKAGQLMRLLNIVIFGKYGAFNCLHDMKDGRPLADHLQTASKKYHGVAGIEYLTKLVAETRSINELAEQYTVALINGESLSSQESRAAKRFALVALAGELATEYGVTGWKHGDACQGVKACFDQWRKGFGGGDTEDRQIKEAIQTYVEMYGDARFTKTTDDIRLHGMRSGYWKDGIHGREWLFSKSGLIEAVKGYDLKKAVDVLKGCGWLIVGGDGKNTTVVRINSKLERLYFICFTDSISDIDKTGVTSVTGVTPYSGAASTVTPAKNESVTGVTKPVTENQSVTPVTPTKNEGVTTQAVPFVAVTPVTPVTPENNNTQSEIEEKINSRSNVLVI